MEESKENFRVTVATNEKEDAKISQGMNNEYSNELSTVGGSIIPTMEVKETIETKIDTYESNLITNKQVYSLRTCLLLVCHLIDQVSNWYWLFGDSTLDD